MLIRAFEEQEEGIQYLKLVNVPEKNQVKLVVCDKDGDELPSGNILIISPKGLSLFDRLGRDLGFPVKDGRIAIYCISTI